MQFWVVTVFHLCPDKPYWPMNKLCFRDRRDTVVDPHIVFNVSAVCKTLHAAVRASMGKVMQLHQSTQGKAFWHGDVQGLAYWHRAVDNEQEGNMKFCRFLEMGYKSYWIHNKLLQHCAKISMQQLLASWKSATYFTKSTLEKPNHVRDISGPPLCFTNDLRWEVLSNGSSAFAEGRYSEMQDID